MARRSGFEKFVSSAIKAGIKAQRQAQAEQQRQLRQQERDRAAFAKASQRYLVQTAKDAKQQYLINQQARVDVQNRELEAQLRELAGILDATDPRDCKCIFKALQVSLDYHQFVPPSDLTKSGMEPRKEEFTRFIDVPSRLGRLIPGVQSKYLQKLKAAENKYRDAHRTWELDERDRKSKLAALQERYENEKQALLLKATDENREAAEFEASYRSGDLDAIEAYCSLVLGRSRYPEGCPQDFELAYVPASKQLVIEYELPSPEIVPAISQVTYVKSRDSIEEKPRKAGEIKELYQDVVASTCLRTMSELFEADQLGYLDLVVFNGFVQSTDPATGKSIRPCLISVRATRGQYTELNLKRINKLACLRNLGAQVSPQPSEMIAVKPVVEFDMVDRRFVEQGNILGNLDSRPNLMDLNPWEFENLVSNLFGKMGLETKLTRSSRDGGVDAVAFDKRPIIGGKVVIQAKRYKNTVGVSAVRDLYGTMMNEGANKGILVTTSTYGPDAYEFVKDKPIELVDGGGLLYLLDQVGIKARILFPEE